MTETEKAILHWEDEGLNEDHPLANKEEINCKKCGEGILFLNEWMRSFVENVSYIWGDHTGIKDKEDSEEDGIYKGVYCLICFIALTYGLDREKLNNFIEENSNHNRGMEKDSGPTKVTVTGSEGDVCLIRKTDGSFGKFLKN